MCSTLYVMSAKVIFPLSLHIVVVVSKFHLSKISIGKKTQKNHTLKYLRDCLFYEGHPQCFRFVNKLQVHFIWIGTVFSLGKL